MRDKPIISGLRVEFRPDQTADAYLSRCAMIAPSEGAKAEMLGIMEIDGRSVGNQGAGSIMQACELYRRARLDCADAAWFLIDRSDYGAWHPARAEAILRDTSPAGIVSDARRYGFNAESDRRLYSGRVVPWELIDAAKALIDRTDNPLEDGHDQYAWIVSATDRLRRALKDL